MGRLVEEELDGMVFQLGQSCSANVPSSSARASCQLGSLASG